MAVIHARITLRAASGGLSLSSSNLLRASSSYPSFTPGVYSSLFALVTLIVKPSNSTSSSEIFGITIFSFWA